MAASKTMTRNLESGEIALDDLPPELLIKHPLQHSWCLWFYKNDRSRSWEENLMNISSFDTVEDFWALYNHIEMVSKLPQGCDYAVFKQGISPMWEDERNKRGGRWLVTIMRQQRMTDLDRFWLEILLCMIGEAFDDNGEDICGAVVQVRNRGDKLALWTADVSREKSIMKIGKIVKERLNLHPSMTIVYEPHEVTQSKAGAASSRHRFSL